MLCEVKEVNLPIYFHSIFWKGCLQMQLFLTKGRLFFPLLSPHFTNFKPKIHSSQGVCKNASHVDMSSQEAGRTYQVFFLSLFFFFLSDVSLNIASPKFCALLLIYNDKKYSCSDVIKTSIYWSVFRGLVVWEHRRINDGIKWPCLLINQWKEIKIDDFSRRQDLFSFVTHRW